VLSTVNKKKPVPRAYILGMSLIFKILLFGYLILNVANSLAHIFTTFLF
jgi:hypothetical protein